MILRYSLTSSDRLIADDTDAAMKLDTSQALAPDLLPRNSGRSGGNTTVRPAVNMDGATARLAAT